MTESLEYIDNYFKKAFTGHENQQFEQRIIEDPAFAEEVAFYIATMQTALQQQAEDKKERFRQLYKESIAEDNVRALGDDDIRSIGRKDIHPGRIRRLFPALVAAAVLLLVVTGWFLIIRAGSPQQLADSYITGNWQSLPVTMTSNESPLQTGLSYYNNGDLPAAAAQFEKSLQTDSSNSKALEYAGIVALRLLQYDKAIAYFRKLEDNTQLFANPGKFDHALTLMKRNQPGDAKAAKELLEQVVLNHLTNKEAADDFLKKL